MIAIEIQGEVFDLAADTLQSLVYVTGTKRE